MKKTQDKVPLISPSLSSLSLASSFIDLKTSQPVTGDMCAEPLRESESQTSIWLQLNWQKRGAVEIVFLDQPLQ